MQLTFIGIGNVGLALAKRFSSLGHDIIVAAHSGQSATLLKAKQSLPALRMASPEEAVREADVVFLATPFGVVEAALAAAGGSLDGKVIVDCTNPVGPGLTHALGNCAGTARLQQKFPASHFVKAFSVYGFENFADDPREVFGHTPLMLIAGNDADAKHIVEKLVTEAGWESLDAGNADAALHLEHMTLLWVKMVRVGGYPAKLTWAKLTDQSARELK